MTTGGKYPTVLAPAAFETLCVTLDDVRAWVVELGAGAPHACRAEAQLYSVAASQLLPALEASQEERAAGFAAAQARERERDAARQAARDRALQVSHARVHARRAACADARRSRRPSLRRRSSRLLSRSSTCSRFCKTARFRQLPLRLTGFAFDESERFEPVFDVCGGWQMSEDV